MSCSAVRLPRESEHGCYGTSPSVCKKIAQIQGSPIFSETRSCVVKGMDKTKKKKYIIGSFCTFCSGDKKGERYLSHFTLTK